MSSRQRPDAIDTRLVYWTYAALAGLGGAFVLLWGPAWFGGVRPGAELIRVLGSILIAAGCFAAALAVVEDPPSRQRGLLWVGIGHAVVLFVVAIQWEVIRGLGLWLAVAFVNTAALVFLYLWQTVEGDPPERGALLTSLFGGRDSTATERLCSRYEQQIRQAASQEERNRLARELHDSIKQQIFVIQTAAATAQVRFDGDPLGVKEALEQVRNSAREAMSEMEAMLDQLRAAPLENNGLVAALRKQCEALGFRTGARVEFKLGPLPPSEGLAPGAQQAILRVAQESISNISRHARAANVLVSLDTLQGRVQLKVQDDGKGFDANQPPHGMGIQNIRARAEEFGGDFELASRPGGGTSMHFSIPYAARMPGDYGHRAKFWGLILIFTIFAALYTKSPLTAAIVLWAAVGFTREARAWLRTRRQAEAAL